MIFANQEKQYNSKSHNKCISRCKWKAIQEYDFRFYNRTQYGYSSHVPFAWPFLTFFNQSKHAMHFNLCQYLMDTIVSKHQSSRPGFQVSRSSRGSQKIAPKPCPAQKEGASQMVPCCTSSIAVDLCFFLQSAKSWGLGWPDGGPAQSMKNVPLGPLEPLDDWILEVLEVPFFKVHLVHFLKSNSSSSSAGAKQLHRN